LDFGSCVRLFKIGQAEDRLRAVEGRHVQALPAQDGVLLGHSRTPVGLNLMTRPPPLTMVLRPTKSDQAKSD